MSINTIASFNQQYASHLNKPNRKKYRRNKICKMVLKELYVWAKQIVTILKDEFDTYVNFKINIQRI